MKRLLCFIAFLTMVLLTTPVKMFADTVDVAVIPPGNINTVINGDTLAGGVRAHPDRVYRLKRGSVYQVTEALNINGSLHIVATDGSGRPPVLAAAILQDNSSIDHFITFIGPGAKVDINDVYFLSARADGAALGWSDGIRINADSIQMNLKGDVFDAFTHTALQGNGQWSKLNVQDCVFRNEMHSTSWFGGGGFISGAPVAQDTCMFLNNTFFCNNSYDWSIRGYSPYAEFSHNTMVYQTVNPFLIRSAQNLHMDNNLFYAVHAMGGNPDHVINGWFLNYPDTASSSIIRLRGDDSTSYWSHLWDATIAGPELADVDPSNGVTADMLTPDKRVYDIRNNAYFWPKKLTDFYKAYNDTVAIYDSVDVPVYGQANEQKMKLKRILYMPTWMSAYTKYTLDTLLAGVSNISVSGNVETDPGFNADVQNQLDNLIAYVHKISTSALDTPWYYHSSASLYPTGGPVWPLAEDLSYTNSDLMHAGTDGFAIGDLNWFPDQKAEWITQITDVNDVNTTPTKFSLSQNYPNPFNPTTRITFNLEKSGFAALTVYNILGQKVATLVSGNLSAGQHEVNFNASNLSTGVYIYKLESGNNTLIKKMMLLK